MKTFATAATVLGTVIVMGPLIAPPAQAQSRSCFYHEFTRTVTPMGLPNRRWFKGRFVNHCGQRVKVRWRDNSEGRCSSTSSSGVSAGGTYPTEIQLDAGGTARINYVWAKPGERLPSVGCSTPHNLNGQ